MKFNDINLDDISTLPFYNKKIAIVNKDDKPVRFQIPKMFMPFGISGFVAGGSPTKWNIDFSMKKGDEFLEFLESFENKIYQEVHKQSQNIFGREYSPEEISAMFLSNIKRDPTGTWEPKFRVKITDGDPIFNENDLQVVEEFHDKLYVKHSGVAIVEPVGVYFMQRKLGIIWKVHQLKIYEPQMLKGFAFRDV